MRSLTSVSREQVPCCAILVVVHGDFRSTEVEFGIGIGIGVGLFLSESENMWKMLRGLLNAGFEGGK
jgi:hypothetical protein